MARRAFRAWQALPTVARDAALAGALLLALLGGAARSTEPHPVGVLALLVLGAASLAWRRARPMTTLVVTSTAFCAATVAVGPGSGAITAVLVSVYTAIAWGRRLAGTVAAGAVLVVVPVVVGLQTGDWFDEVVLAVAALLAVAVAAGSAMGSRRAVIAQSRERAERAEQTRELEAARRVAEERVRIARELHDVLGHHVAVIGVQAGVAEMLLVADVEGARTALGHVQDASESVLSELGALVEVLREPDDDLRAAPAQGMVVLDGLLADARATGLVVGVDGSGDPRPLAPVVDLTAFRVIQEALTNAHKHGTGRARLRIVWGAYELHVDVTNPVRPGDLPGGDQGVTSHGFGLVGMRERVAAVGGSARAERYGDHYRVSVTLPIVPPADHPATGTS